MSTIRCPHVSDIRSFVPHCTVHPYLDREGVIGTVKILTPCRSETPKNIKTRIGQNNYVMCPFNPANFCIGLRWSAHHIAEI